MERSPTNVEEEIQGHAAQKTKKRGQKAGLMVVNWRLLKAREKKKN